MHLISGVNERPQKKVKFWVYVVGRRAAFWVHCCETGSVVDNGRPCTTCVFGNMVAVCVPNKRSRTADDELRRRKWPLHPTIGPS